MFEDDIPNLKATLGAMHSQALEKCNYHKGEALDLMVRYASQDRRFDGFNKGALATAVKQELEGDPVALRQLLDRGQKR